jgi:hypothetical protein
VSKDKIIRPIKKQERRAFKRSESPQSIPSIRIMDQSIGMLRRAMAPVTTTMMKYLMSMGTEG